MESEFSFSVAMCVYGGDNPEWFRMAINSIYYQTVKPSEIVLVVDGPIPATIQDVIDEFKQKSTDVTFKVVYLEQNMGHGIARRRSFDECTCDYVAIMDADDISLENRFELEIDTLKQTNADIVGGDIAEFIDSTENIVGYRRLPTEDVEIKAYAKSRCPFNQVSVMIRKKAYDAAGGYIDWYCEEDYYLWLRMMLEGCKFANTGVTLVYVRVGKEMYQRRGGMPYYKSEKKLQKYMLEKGIIGRTQYWSNCVKRLIVQVLMPNWMRSWAFKVFAREKK